MEGNNEYEQAKRKKEIMDMTKLFQYKGDRNRKKGQK